MINSWICMQRIPKVFMNQLFSKLSDHKHLKENIFLSLHYMRFISKAICYFYYKECKQAATACSVFF
jgi:hypothetical protein